MANRNKQRGKQFENRVAEIIRRKWNLTRKECHRALSSGTFRTDFSDIEIMPFEYKMPYIIIECKYRKPNTLTYRKFINPDRLLEDWYEQITIAGYKFAEEFGKFPLRLIVYGIPNVMPMVALFDPDWSDLLMYPERYNLQVDEKKIGRASYCGSIITSNKQLRFFTFWIDEFFEFTKPIKK